MENLPISDFIKNKITAVLYQSRQTLIAWIETDRILYNYSSGFLAGEAYKQHGLRMVDAVGKYNALKMFSDIKDLQVLTSADQKWADEVLIPGILQKGLRHSAYLIPADIFGQISVDKLTASVHAQGQGRLLSRPFADEHQAYQWLQKAGA